MDPFVDAAASRWVAAGFFLGVAAVLGLIYGCMVVLKRQASWPMFVGGILGIALWQLIAAGLIVDGATVAGLALSAIAAAVLLAGCCTFLINNHSWLVAVVFALLGIGALLIPGDNLTFILAGSLAGVLIVMVAVVLLSGWWWAPAAYAVAALTLVAVGGASALATSVGVGVWERNVGNIRASEPYWLGLLVLVPLTIMFSFRSLAGLGAVRRWLALGCAVRCWSLLCLALAEVYLLQTSDTMTVLFLWDRSLSIPEEFDPNDSSDPKKDLIKERHLAFINNAVALRGNKHSRDAAGLIVFGRYPRLELPPSVVPHFRLRKITSPVG